MLVVPVTHGFNLSEHTALKLKDILAGGSAVTIGSFDGLHLGHQQIFKKLFLAAGTNLKKICITFEPSPKDFFNKINNKIVKTDSNNSFNRLTLFKDKINFLKQLGFDLVLVLNFNKNTAEISATDFINKVIEYLNLKYLVVGSDFKFGYKQEGDINFLKNYFNNKFLLETDPGSAHFVLGWDDSAKKLRHFEYIENYIINNIINIRVSSSVIKKILTATDIDTNNLELAKEYLGRYYGFTGKVKRGKQQGRLLGYPTVNINVKPNQLVLSIGVYIVYIYFKGKKYQAMANWGVRPTLNQQPELVLEANIFDFSTEIYNQDVYIEFIKKIRPEQKFQSIDQLKLQLANDKRLVKQYFENKK
jgi:riboflavin kinase/FMN adenylyltransferase